MVSLTLSVPLELKKKMDKHREIRWSEVVRAILERQISDLDEVERLSAKSKLTERDVEEFARKVDEEMAAHFKRVRRETSY